MKRYDFTPSGISQMAKQLERIEKELSAGMPTLVRELVERGEIVARGCYGDSVSVTSSVDNSGGTITASGKAVMFMEFGAGRATIDNNFSANLPVWEGAYSETVGSGEYARTGRWHFGGRVYTFVQPRMGMFNAEREILDVYQEKARGVFG